MNQNEKFNLAKLHMIQALARSQTAIARILEQAAEVTCEYRVPASLLREQLRCLADYQSVMIGQLTGLRMRNIVHGTSSRRPWLNRGVFHRNRSKCHPGRI